MTIFELKNKIHEIISYIASDWPDVEERKNLYKKLYELEALLEEKKREETNKQEEN